MWNFSPTPTNTDKIFISKPCFFCQIWQKSLISGRAKFYRSLLVYSSSIFFSRNDFKYSNKFFSGSQYCSLLKDTVACNRLCQQGVMGICEEFGSFNEMRHDSGVCFHICNDTSICLPKSLPFSLYLHPPATTTTTIHTESSSIIPTFLLFHKLFSVYTNCIYFIKYFHKNINLVYLRLHFLLGHTG